eukprot:CAMPEP_0114520156 /NCGR_PEP_ID=MMETSP0109-20121206/19413_1 /TAXON_ID=29199 /ORGANISM="Chlorarachnion reptans, Strain CCCM449" /LENGTH=288 /DNA_ID=CAMNT_0001700997 /DNA_START=154 /DNA_END=1020 /DNA_ORIENTATION=-
MASFNPKYKGPADRIQWALVKEDFKELSQFSTKQLSGKWRWIRSRPSRPWTDEEDEALSVAVKESQDEHGFVSWTLFSESIPELRDRGNRELRERWKQLQMKSTRPWNGEELTELLSLVDRLRDENGNITWKDVVQRSRNLKNRRPLEAKIQYNIVIRRKKYQKGRVKQIEMESAHSVLAQKGESYSHVESENKSLETNSLRAGCCPFGSVGYESVFALEERAPKRSLGWNMIQTRALRHNLSFYTDKAKQEIDWKKMAEEVPTFQNFTGEELRSAFQKLLCHVKQTH